PHAAADGDRFPNRGPWMLAFEPVEVGLLVPTAKTQDDAARRKIVHSCDGARRQAWVTNVGVRDLRLYAEPLGGLGTRGHRDQAVGHEAPVTDSKAVESDLFA